MAQFKCSACGHVYGDDHNFTVCPVCMGLGKPDEKCTCQHWRQAFGGPPINAISKINPNCPIHGIGEKPNEICVCGGKLVGQEAITPLTDDNVMSWHRLWSDISDIEMEEIRKGAKFCAKCHSVYPVKEKSVQ